MKYRFLYFSLFFVILFNCAETDVDNNVRVIVSGNIIDQNNLPIDTAEIKIETLASGTGALPVLLGEGFSNTDGHFSITSLFGSNTRFTIEVGNGTSFSSYEYLTNTNDYVPEDLEFDLGEIELKTLSNFEYNISRESGLGNSLEYNFEYISPICLQIFEAGILNENDSFCHDTQNVGRTLNDDSPDIENRSFIVPLDSQINFTYKLNGGEEVSEIITINTIPYEFQFTY